MSRVENVVFVNSYRQGRNDIEEVFQSENTVYLQAQSQAIQIAISLAEHFVKTLKIARYEKFTSSMVENQQHKLVPKCSIILKYQQEMSNQKKSTTKERSEQFDRREEPKPKKVYREREGQKEKDQRDYNRKEK